MSAKKKAKRPVRMTPEMLERRIRAGLRRFRLVLSPGALYSGLDGECCAVGGALAAGCKDTKARKAAFHARLHEDVDPRAQAARMHGLATVSMERLECGFDGTADYFPYLARGPFYRLGRKLRAEADAKAGAK